MVYSFGKVRHQRTFSNTKSLNENLCGQVTLFQFEFALVTLKI